MGESSISTNYVLSYAIIWFRRQKTWSGISFTNVQSIEKGTAKNTAELTKSSETLGKI